MSTEITEHQVKLKEVLKGAKGELIVLQDIEQTKEQILVVVNKHKDLVVTEENFKESKEARAELRDIRYGLQNILKHNVSILNEAKRLNTISIDEVIGIVSPTEEKIDEGIKLIENAKKIEKERKEKEELERIAKINRTISDSRIELEKLVSFGRSDDDIEKYNALVLDLKDRNSKEEFQEFGFDIDNLIDENQSKFEELEKRVQKIKDDAEQEKKNEVLKIELERKNKFIQLGLVEIDGAYQYKGKVIHDANIVLYTGEMYEEGLKFIQAEIKTIDTAEAKAKEEKELSEKKEREDFLKEKAEYEARKKSETFEYRKKVLLSMGFEYIETIPNKDNYNFILGHLEYYEESIKNDTDEGFAYLLEAINEAKAIHNQKIIDEKNALENELEETIEKAKKLGISNKDINPTDNKKAIILTLQQQIKEAELKLTEHRKTFLKEAGLHHVVAIEQLKKQMHDYFASCKIQKEHENFITEFEDEIRASFKKLKNSIS